MNYRTLAMVGVRLLAVWLIVIGIGALPYIQFTWQTATVYHHPGSPGIAVAYTATICAIVVPLILGVCLWALAPRLSRWMAPAEQGAPPAAAAPILVQGAIAIAGLVIAVNALPNLIYAIVEVVREVGNPSEYPEAWMAWIMLAERVILVLLALGLILGARRLREWIFRLRTLGT